MSSLPLSAARRRVKRLPFAAIAFGAALLAGCLGDGPAADVPTSYLRVVQAVPNAPTMNVLVDTTARVNGLSYSAIAGFLPLDAGLRRIRFIPAAGGAAMVDNSLMFVTGEAYTVMPTGLFGDVQSVVVPDTAAFPVEGEFKVRVIQAAPAAGAVDVYITDANALLASSTPVISSLQFRGVLDYVTVPVGRNRIRLTAAGTTTVVLDVSQVFGQRSMRTIIATDAPGGGLPLASLVLIDL